MYKESEFTAAEERAISALEAAGHGLVKGEHNITDPFDAHQCVEYLSAIFDAFLWKQGGPDWEERRANVMQLLGEIEVEAAIKLAEQS